MKLHTKSFLYLFIVSILSISVSIGIIVATFSAYSDRLNRDRDTEVTRIIQYNFDTMVRNFGNLLSGYAYWDDVDLHLAHKDFQWLKDNATLYLVSDPRYDIDLVYFRSDRYKYKEYYGNLPLKSVETAKVNDEIRKGKIMSSSFQVIGDEIYVLVAAPITDNDQKHPDGIFMLGRRIDNKLVEDLAVLLNAKGVSNLGFEILKTPMSHNRIELDKGHQKYYFPLASDTNAYGYLTVETTDLTIQTLINDTMRNVIVAVVAMSALSTLLIFMLFYRTSQNIESSVQTINAISEGQYHRRLNIKTSLEFTLLSDSVNKLASDFQTTLDRLGDNYIEIISMMIKIIEVTDHYTRGHSERVSHYAVAIAEEMGLENIETIRVSGLMHDIGKIAIDGNILNKVSELTKEEFEWIQSHPTVAYKILDLSNLFTESKEIILCHHEYYDGKGYPRGLRGENIPLAARILCVADAFDAMTSDRSYRPAISLMRAIEIIHSGSGGQFDPDVVIAFEKIALRIYSDWSTLDKSPSIAELIPVRQMHSKT